MGDPKKITNKFQKPMHPWNKARLEMEKPLMQKYGLEAKNELWKITSKLKTIKANTKRLIVLKGTQAEKERTDIFERLKSFGLVQTNNIDDILGLTPEQLLDRRLQTVVLKKGLARTIKQARQMITHRHISVNGKKVTAPSYLVRIEEEHTVEFYSGSKFSREDHPERPSKEQVAGREQKAEAPVSKPHDSKPHDSKQRRPMARKPRVEKSEKSNSEKVKGEKKDE
jgi:small subunit ribosomal protein S4